MQINVALTISTIVDKFYPGGMPSFTENGGGIFMSPDPINEILIALPSDTPAKIKDLTKNLKNCRILPAMSIETAEELAERVKVKLESTPDYMLSVFHGVIVLILPFNNSTDDIFTDACSKLKEMDELFLVYIIARDGKVKRMEKDQEEITFEIKKTSMVPTETRTKSITDDDILNLKITLETVQDSQQLIDSL